MFYVKHSFALLAFVQVVILSERSESKDPVRCQPEDFRLSPHGILRLRAFGAPLRMTTLAILFHLL